MLGSFLPVARAALSFDRALVMQERERRIWMREHAFSIAVYAVLCRSFENWRIGEETRKAVEMLNGV